MDRTTRALTFSVSDAFPFVEVQEESPPPGAPSGEYVTIIYESRFSAWERPTERVTLMREETAGWRVLGYLASGAG